MEIEGPGFAGAFFFRHARTCPGIHVFVVGQTSKNVDGRDDWRETRFALMPAMTCE